MSNLKVNGLDIGANNLTIDNNGKLLVNGTEVSGSEGLDTTNFNNNLSSNDDTIQKAFETLDDLVVGSLLTSTPQLSLTSGTFASESVFTITIQNYDATASYFITETADDLSNSATRVDDIITVTLGEVTDGVNHTFSFNVTAQVSGTEVSNPAVVNITVTPMSLLSDTAVVWQRGVDTDTDTTELVVNTGTETQDLSDGDWGKYQNTLEMEPTDIFIEKNSDTEVTVNHPITSSNNLYLYDGDTIEERDVTSVAVADMTSTHDVFRDSSAVATFNLDGNTNDLGSNYNGTPTDVTYSAGKNGQAGVFNGSSSYVELGGKLVPQTSSFSISLWFNHNLSGNFGLIFCQRYNPDTSYKSYQMSVDDRIGEKRAKSIIGDGSNVSLVSTPTIPSAGQWHHMTATYNSATQKHKLYFNGVLVETDTGVVSNISQGANTVIGRWGDVSDNYFNGMVDNVRVFNKELTEEEVNKLYIKQPPVYKATIPTYTNTPTKTFLVPTTKTALKATNDITSFDLVEDMIDTQSYNNTTNLLTINYTPNSSGQGRYIESEISDLVNDTDVRQLITNVWELQ